MTAEAKTLATEPLSVSGEGWEMRLGDCLEGMRALPDKSVDVVITDPPYDEHTHKAGRRGTTGYREAMSSSGATFSRKRDLGFEALTLGEMETAASHFSRLSTRWVLVFCSLEMISDWKAALERNGLDYVRTCIWHKVNSTPQFTGDRPSVAAEAIVCAHPRGVKRWNSGGKHGWYEHPIVLNRPGTRERRLHTTQKPLSLISELIADFTDPGELVLDAYAGSGTTGFAARRLGRRFLGWERAKCAACSATAYWACSWTDGEDGKSAHLCHEHRDLLADSEGFRSVRENYFEIACRRLNGDEAKPRPEQPSLLEWSAR